MRAATVLCVACALGACEAPRVSHGVAYYRDHADARRTEVAACSDAPTIAGAPDCLAALKAQAAAESQRALRYQPPPSRLNRTGDL